MNRTPRHYIGLGAVFCILAIIGGTSYVYAAEHTSILAHVATEASQTDMVDGHEVSYTAGSATFTFRIPNDLKSQNTPEGMTLLRAGILQQEDTELNEGFSIHIANTPYADGQTFDEVLSEHVSTDALLGQIVEVPHQIVSPISERAFQYRAETMSVYTVEIHDLGSSYVTIIYESFGLLDSYYEKEMNSILKTMRVETIEA